MASGFKTFAEVVSFAIMREEEAYKFYMELAAQSKDPFMKDIFTNFAEEELKHQTILKNLDATGVSRIFDNILKRIDELHVAETLKDVPPKPDMDFKDLLVIAMKREEKSQNLYSFLAETSEDNDVALLFVGLAKEEAQHKLRIEKTYNQLFAK